MVRMLNGNVGGSSFFEGLLHKGIRVGCCFGKATAHRGVGGLLADGHKKTRLLGSRVFKRSIGAGAYSCPMG